MNRTPLYETPGRRSHLSSQRFFIFSTPVAENGVGVLPFVFQYKMFSLWTMGFPSFYPLILVICKIYRHGLGQRF